MNDHQDERLLRAPGPERQRARRMLADELFGREQVCSHRSARSAPLARGEQRESEYDEHDRHFGVVRVRGDSGAIFLTSLLVSYLDMLEDVEHGGSTLEQAQWADLLRVPTLVFGFAQRRRVSASPDRNFPIPVGRRELLPQRRWHVGHRLFFTLIQSTTQAVHSLSEAARVRDEAAVREYADLVRLTTLGSTAALRLTADFSPADYEKTVRPTMLPPHVGPGFSGLQTRDHHHLVNALGELRADMPTVARLGEPHTELIAAIRSLHDAHAYVCTRFGGDTAPSLRMEALGQQDRKGAEVVRGLSRHRESILEPAPASTGKRPGAHQRSEEVGHGR